MHEEIDLVSSPKKSYIKLSLPIIAFCIFDAIYGLVDMAWVSGLSKEAFFALGVSIPLTTLIFSLGDSIGQGTNSIMSRFIGSKDYENGYNAFLHGILLNIMLWVIVLIALYFIDILLSTMSITKSLDLIKQYLTPITICSFSFIFVNLFSETFQAEGNSKTPTLMIIASNILNIVLDPIFIYDFKLGVSGAAYATILSSLIIFAILLFHYLSGRTKVPLSIKYFKFRPYIIKEILKVTFPNFADSGSWCFLAVLVNIVLMNHLGPIGPILYSVSLKIQNLMISPIKGFGRALMSVTGHLFGARDYDNILSTYYYALKLSFITAIIIAAVFIVFREVVYEYFHIFEMDFQIAWIAIVGTINIFCIVLKIISSKTLDGLGKSLYALLFNILGTIAQVGIIYIAIAYMDGGRAVLLSFFLNEFISVILIFGFLQYLFRTFDKKSENEKTVKTFDN